MDRVLPHASAAESQNWAIHIEVARNLGHCASRYFVGCFVFLCMINDLQTDSKSIKYVALLKWSKMPPKDITKVYAILVRPLLEYASSVWHGCLTDQQYA